MPVIGGVLPTTTALTTGCGPIALVQNGATTNTIIGAGTSPIPFIIATASSSGTALVAVIASSNAATPVVVSMPAGWARLVTISETTFSLYEVWAYLNNPGGLLSFNAQTTSLGSTRFYTHVSEWSNVFAVSALEASGTATATAGTTLAPATTTTLISQGDLAISGWDQGITGAPAAVVFTSPPGWTRLKDTGAEVAGTHLDLEYLLGPPVGAILGPTLTSDTASIHAAGAIVVLKKKHDPVDQTVNIEHGTLGASINSLDVNLIFGGKLLQETSAVDGYLLEDGSGVLLLDNYTPVLGDCVSLTGPTWNGRVVSVTQTDIVQRAVNYKRVTLAATNSAVASATPIAPGNLTDAAVSGGHYLLEDGSGALLLEDSTGYLLLEGTNFNYRDLSVQQSQNQDGTTTTYGAVTVFETGFAAGQTITITSTNQGRVAESYTITNVREAWLGAAVTGQPTPEYVLEFGDAYQTLQQAGGGVLTRQASTATSQLGVVTPGGVLGYAAITADQTLITTEVDVTGLTVTVTVAAGRRIQITGFCLVDSTTATDTMGIKILEGATQLQLAQGPVGGTVSHGELSPMVILTPTAGVHTYKLTALRVNGAGNCAIRAATTNPAWLLAMDIGT